MATGVIISKPGQSVRPFVVQNLIFSSNWFLFKQSSTGSTVVFVPAGTPSFQSATTTIAHGLGYTPAIIGYWSLDNATWRLIEDYSGAVNNSHTCRLTADATNVYITAMRFNNADTSFNCYVRWKIFIDPGKIA